MIRALGEERDARHETERFEEIGKAERAYDRAPLGVVSPQRKRRHRRAAGIRIEAGDHRHGLACPRPFVQNAIRMQSFAPDAAAIETLARAAIAALPPAFRRHLDGVVLRVEEFADDDVLAELGIDDPFALSGLYTGRPMPEKSSVESGALPDTIHLYRRPLLDEWIETDVSLEDLVAHVLVHEAGHHFGLSDADMHALEDTAD